MAKMTSKNDFAWAPMETLYIKIDGKTR